MMQRQYECIEQYECIGPSGDRDRDGPLGTPPGGVAHLVVEDVLAALLVVRNVVHGVPVRFQGEVGRGRAVEDGDREDQSTSATARVVRSDIDVDGVRVVRLRRIGLDDRQWRRRRGLCRGRRRDMGRGRVGRRRRRRVGGGERGGLRRGGDEGRRGRRGRRRGSVGCRRVGEPYGCGG